MNEVITGCLNMSFPDEEFILHKGDFFLKSKDIKIPIKGNIKFVWQPYIRVVWSGTVSLIFHEKNNIFDSADLSVEVENIDLGDVFVIECSSQSDMVKGVFYELPCLGDTSVRVDKINFSVPNLKSFALDQVSLPDRSATWSGRLSMETDRYIITLDKTRDHKLRSNKLKISSGYFFLYEGQIISKKSSVSLYEITDLVNGLGLFLSFVNGRRVGPMFLRGITNQEVLWTKISGQVSDRYMPVTSWSSDTLKGNRISELWNNFHAIWDNTNDNSFLLFSIKWYCEANSGDISSDTRLIMAQTTLELIYNWWIIDKLKLIGGRDASNISAANKIRLILIKLEVSPQIPQRLESLSKIINKEIADGPDAIVSIRNSFVHSDKNKRNRVVNYGEMVRIEALKLAIWYVELSLLRILNFNNSYYNRCQKKSEILPWKKSKI